MPLRNLKNYKTKTQSCLIRAKNSKLEAFKWAKEKMKNQIKSKTKLLWANNSITKIKINIKKIANRQTLMPLEIWVCPHQ